MLDHLEFHHLYESLSADNMKHASFKILSSQEIKKLGIRLPVGNIHAENIEDFKAILGNSSNTITIYSRHADMLDEFLKENNFGHIKIQKVTSHILQSFQIE